MLHILRLLQQYISSFVFTILRFHIFARAMDLQILPGTWYEVYIYIYPVPGMYYTSMSINIDSSPC